MSRVPFFKTGTSSVFVLLCSLFCSPLFSSGWELDDQSGNFHYTAEGFGTIGGVVSDSNTLGFKRDILQSEVVTKNSPQLLTDSRLGLQFSAEYQTKVQGTIQFLAKQDTETFDQFLNLAYLGLNVTPQLSIRGGRLPLDICLLSENRDVGYSYLWSRPIPEFYGQLFLTSFNGFDLSYKFQTEIGLFELRGATGSFETTIPYNYGADLDASLRDFWNANIRYEKSSWQLRLAYMQVTIDEVTDNFKQFAQYYTEALSPYLPVIKPYFDQFLHLEGSTFNHLSMGLGYNDNRWNIQSEIGRLQFEQAMSLTFTSAYLSVGYRFHDLTPYGILAHLQSKTDTLPHVSIDHYPAPIQEAVASVMNALESIQASQTTASLGLRWDFHTHAAMKLQWNHHWVSGRGSYLWDNSFVLSEDTEVNTFSLSLDFMF